MSSEGFVLRFLLGLMVGVSVLLFAVGCSLEQRQAAGGVVLAAGQERGLWASNSELAWLRRLGAWDRRLMRGLRAAASGGSLEDSRPAFSCSADLRRRVGPAPTDRLGRALTEFRRACAHLERFHVALTFAVQREDTQAHGRAQLEARKGAALLLRADQMLPPGEVRGLPVVAGVTGRSRVEPRFGRVASALAGKQVEVRCWSPSDWRRLMREEHAYTRGQLSDDTLGFAGIGAARVNLAPEVCASLVRLAYGGARPRDDAGRLLLAAAVVTLSHEPQHSAGIVNEAVAECNAIQVAHRTAMKLGAGRALAELLVRTYWRHYDDELAAYRSEECRDGGALDLGYSDSIWP